MNKALILWLRKRGMGPWHQRIINSFDKLNMYRFMPFWPDEFYSSDGVLRNKMPWYRPFNILMHCWVSSDTGLMHDHPRWSITIVLRGFLIEETPWGKRCLSPGSVVIRSRKNIHRFHIQQEDKGKTWTLFIVGRRKHKQQYYRMVDM